MCKCVVFLIDRTTRAQQGHQSQYVNYFSKALQENNQNFFLVNHVLDVSDDYNCQDQNFNVWAKKQKRLTELEITSVLNIVEKNKIDSFHLFFTWTGNFLTKDLQNWQLSLVDYKYSIEGLGSASGWLRQLNHGEREFKHIYQFINSFPRTRFLSWDSKLNELNDDRLQQLPDFAQQISRPNNPSGEITLGFFGPGTNDRGFSTYLIMAALNPRIKFKFYGRRVEWMRLINLNFHAPKLNKFLSRCLSFLFAPLFITISKLRRVEMQIGYPELSTLLTQMQTCHAIFYQSKFRGESSGLVLHALAARVPVMYMGENSQITDWLDFHFVQGRLTHSDYMILGRLRKRISQISSENLPDVPTWDEFKSAFLAFECDVIS
jgi:hypothetical protein